MEAFETFVALALEEEGFIVSPAVKFPVRRQVRKASRVQLAPAHPRMFVAGIGLAVLETAMPRASVASR